MLWTILVVQLARILTLSPLIPLRLYTLPYWSNTPFLILDIQAFWCSWLTARVPECQKIKNSGLDQYGTEPYEQQQFGTAGVKRVDVCCSLLSPWTLLVLKLAITLSHINPKARRPTSSSDTGINPNGKKLATSQLMFGRNVWQNPGEPRDWVTQ